MDSSDAPGYCVLQSAGSRRGQNFVVGSGAKVPNRGEVHLNKEAMVGGESQPLQSIFQVAKITRPLMSVSRICDEGLRCIFSNEKAEVIDANGIVLCEFQRQGGLYVGKMKLKCPKNPTSEPAVPQPFTRPGR